MLISINDEEFMILVKALSNSITRRQRDRDEHRKEGNNTFADIEQRRIDSDYKMMSKLYKEQYKEKTASL